MNFDQAPEFAKELKQLGKKWRRLPEDLAVLQATIATLYKGANGLPPTHLREAFFQTKKAAVLAVLSPSSEIVKIRLDSQDLNSNKLRVVYMQQGENVILIELFAKNDRERENQGRISKYIKFYD